MQNLTTGKQNYDETLFLFILLRVAVLGEKKVFCEFHNCDKWFVNYIYYKIVWTWIMIIFEYCPFLKKDNKGNTKPRNTYDKINN